MKIIKSAVVSILPFYFIILLFSVIFNIFTLTVFIRFTFSTLLLILGMIFFILGVNSSIENAIPLLYSATLNKKSKNLIFVFSFILCFFATISEPNLHIFINQLTSSLPSLNKILFLFLTCFSVSLFLLFSILRLYLHINLKYVFVVLYGVFFVLSCFLSNYKMCITLDSAGGVTGLVTVPFISILGVSIAETIEKKNNSDKFGFISISSIGVMIVIGIYLLFLTDNITVLEPTQNDLSFFDVSLSILKSSLKIVIPFLVAYLIIFIFFVKIRGYVLRSKIFGILFLVISVLLILTSTIPVYIPYVESIASCCVDKGLISTLLIAMILGFLTAFFEPSILVLSDNIEKEFHGKLNKKLIVFAIGIGLSLAMGISVLFIYKGIEMKIIFYVLYFFILLFVFITDDIFIGLSFDAGAGAAGVMSGIILLPFITKIAEIKKGSSLFGFGVVGIVVAIPILVCEVIGIVYKFKISGKKNEKQI